MGAILSADDPEEREQRRKRLVKRLTLHGARMKEIYELTGYTRNRQSWLRMRSGFPKGLPPRGPWPSAMRRFFTDESRDDATCAALFCAIFEADRYETGKRAPFHLGTLEPGENLSEAWEAFQVHLPDSTLGFPEFILLAKSLTRGDEIQLARCACGQAFLRDMLSAGKAECARCTAAYRESDENKASPISTVAISAHTASSRPGQLPLPLASDNDVLRATSPREPVNGGFIEEEQRHKAQRQRQHRSGRKVWKAVERKESRRQKTEQREQPQDRADHRLEHDQERQNG